MSTTASLSGSHLRTYRTLWQHPIAHNLGWRDVHALLRSLGDLHEEPNGNLKATRHGHSLVLRLPLTKDVETPEEIMALRKFIEQSEPSAPSSTNAANPSFAPWGNPGAPTLQCLLVIDHHAARIYHLEQAEPVPEQVLPHAPTEFFRHAHNSLAFSRGKEKPEPNSFFNPVAQALQGAGAILLFGSGTGMSSEMDQFVNWVKTHRPDVAARIIGAQVVDEHHLTEGQLIAQAREVFRQHQPANARVTLPPAPVDTAAVPATTPTTSPAAA